MNRTRLKGVSLVEIMVVIGIIGILMLVALPSYQVWIQNSRIRNTAESIMNAMQLTRNEAVRRNARVKFELNNISGTTWRICLPVAGTTDCDAGVAAIQSQTGNDADSTVENGVLRQSEAPKLFTDALAGGTSIPANIIFDSFGRIVSTDAVDDIARIDVRNPSLAPADERRLVILISPTGAIRMCDPQLPSTAPKNPQAC